MNLQKHTPMMRQYDQAKKACGDALLLFRMGDFYELFHDDARTAAKILGLTLTSRDKTADPVPMAGFPHHQLETYLAKLVKQGLREFKQLVHPQAIIPIKLGNRPVGDRVLSAVWGFFALYMFCFAILMLLLLATGLDFITAFSAVGAAINNLGPGLGDVTAHYGNINNPAKWLLCFAMLLGRLEIFTLLALFTPTFWRR